MLTSVVLPFRFIEGTGGRLLEQKIPLSYIHLQEVVRSLAKDRRQMQKDPVLYGAQYKYSLISMLCLMVMAGWDDCFIVYLQMRLQFCDKNSY